MGLKVVAGLEYHYLFSFSLFLALLWGEADFVLFLFPESYKVVAKYSNAKEILGATLK